MARRNTDMFNLSFLDLLSGALGAVIFMFIITPKGGEPAAKIPQVIVSVDSIHNQIFGGLHDSLAMKQPGDTLLVLIKDFEKMPSIEDCPECPPSTICPECPKCPTPVVQNNNERSKPDFSQKRDNPRPPIPIAIDNPTHEEPEQPKQNNNDSKYKGDPPSVPCKVSFEVNWHDIKDNVDLYVCKDGECVFGSKRKSKDIGFWDSGKSRPGLFGGDVRTTQEAIRQFDKVLPGVYKIYAQFKASAKKNNSVFIKGLIYTRGENGKEQGENFTKTLKLDSRNRTHLGTVEMRADGSFKFTKH